MTRQRYLLLSATIFSLVSLAHLLRIILDWPARVGPIDLPVWLSWFGFIVPGVIAIWGFRLARTERLRMGRGSLRGIDTTVDREEDRC